MMNDNYYNQVHWEKAVSASTPEYEVVGLTFRQKLALEWIIFKAWCKRVFDHA